MGMDSEHWLPLSNLNKVEKHFYNDECRQLTPRDPMRGCYLLFLEGATTSRVDRLVPKWHVTALGNPGYFYTY